MPGRSPTATFATVPALSHEPFVSVVVPAHLADSSQAAFVPAALDCLLAQTLTDWEAVVVDDGSPLPVEPLLPSDPRIRLLRHDRNRGLGAALNTGLDATTAGYVAYLPVDDLIVPEHLAVLAAALDCDAEAALAVAGVRHSYNRYSPGRIEGRPLQLVQVMHRRTDDRWVEREEPAFLRGLHARAVAGVDRQDARHGAAAPAPARSGRPVRVGGGVLPV